MIDFDATVLAACAGAFGEVVTYQPANAPAVGGVSGIFNDNHTTVTFENDVPVSSTQPMLGIRLSALPQMPAEGDSFVIRGGSYLVRRVAADGEGHAAVFLNGPLP